MSSLRHRSALLPIILAIFISLARCQPLLYTRDVSASNCGANGNTDTICFPLPGTELQNGTWYQIVWNPTYPSYAAAESLDIHIYLVQYYQSILTKSWKDVNAPQGTLPVLVDNSWLTVDPVAGKHDILLYIVRSGIDPTVEMKNIHSIYPPPVALSVKVPGQDSTSQNQLTREKDLIHPWAVVVVVVACVITVIASIIIAWYYRRIRKRTTVYNEKSGPGEATGIENSGILGSDMPLMPQSSYCGSINSRRRHTSLTPLSMVTDNAAIDQHSSFIRPHSTLSYSNISTRSSEIRPLTSTDALLIADTFRQHMRRPEWVSQQESQDPTECSNHSDDERLRNQQEERRREISDALLKKELAAEGTLMKKVGKRAQLLSTRQKE